MNDVDREVITIIPKKTVAGIMSSLLLVVIFLILVMVVNYDLGPFVSVLFYLMLSASIFFLTIYFLMKYELFEEYIKLTCGPFSWKIKYENIEKTYIENLKYHPTSTGWKLPGYALFSVYYTNIGNVTMCSTRALKNIVLIKTDKKLYGISPPDPDFVIKFIREKQK